MLASGVAFRALFLAARSDWHGGFCLGPRFRVTSLPLLLLPAGELILWARGRTWRSRALFSACVLAMAQQLYFSLGEVFAYLHLERWRLQSLGLQPFADDALYLDLALSPVWRLHESGLAGPWALGPGGRDLLGLWAPLSAAGGVALWLLFRRAGLLGRSTPPG